jgi:hypothetical protein
MLHITLGTSDSNTTTGSGGWGVNKPGEEGYAKPTRILIFHQRGKKEAVVANQK